jgi:tetratricopeptide (TPR) repeat protein
MLAAATLSGCAANGTRSATGADQGALPDFVPQSAAGAYLAAREAESEGDRSTAATYMSQALALDPGNVDFLRDTFQLYLGEGRIADADRLARRLVAADPKNHLGNLVLALEDAKSGAWDKAAARMAALPPVRLATVTAPLVGAWALQGAGKTDEALATLDRLSSVRGFAVLRDLHRGFIADLAGRADLAEASYQKAIAAEGVPSFRAIEACANFYARQGRTADALALLEKFKASNPDTVRLEETVKLIASGAKPPTEVPDARVGLAEAMFDVGSALHQEETERLSLEFIRLSLSMAPDFTVAKLALADLLSNDGNDTEALDYYNSVPRTSPLYFSARLRAADTLRDEGRLDDALKTLRELSAAWPDRADPLATEGDFLRMSERFPEAVKAYDGAVARLGKIRPADWGLFYARGVALERSGNWPRAEADFIESLKLSPDQPSVLNYLGYSWVDRGVHLEKAKGMIERAVQLKPDDGYIVDSLGWALYRAGDYQRAVTDLERAVELKPDDPVINDHLGDAYWRVGRVTEARFQWRRALALKPEPSLQTQLGLKLEHGLRTQTKLGEHDS